MPTRPTVDQPQRPDPTPTTPMRLADEPRDLGRPSPFSARRLAIMAIFIALSAVGSLIKIPSPLGTVGLDSAPGFFAALAFGGPTGAVVIAVGHLLTSAIVGFPMTLPMHLAIALGMAGCAVALRWVARRGGTVRLVVAAVVAALLNSVVLGLTVLPIGGWGMYAATVPFLLVGAVLNLAIAAIAYRALRGSRLLG